MRLLPSQSSCASRGFEGVEDLELGGFNHQNVLFDLLATRGADGTWSVELLATYGVGGRFRCHSITIG